MSKIPIKPIVELAKQHGPTVGNFVKKNWKEISQTVGVVGTVGKTANNLINNRKETNQKKGKIHYRKTRFVEYKTETLRSLDSKNREQLFKHQLEVEQFINQIKNEENKESGLKKPLHSKRINDWKSILVQIEDKIVTRDYQEYLMIYNNIEYHSAYFEGYEGQITKFKELVNKGILEELYNFIQITTRKNIDDIKRDFL